MQYHKHMYPGIMKRWRRRGYYNEFRGSVERGSYVSLASLLSTEFRSTIKKLKSYMEMILKLLLWKVLKI